MDMEGALHHVMVRGLEARAIFLSDKDREDLVNRLEKGSSLLLTLVSSLQINAVLHDQEERVRT